MPPAQVLWEGAFAASVAGSCGADWEVGGGGWERDGYERGLRMGLVSRMLMMMERLWSGAEDGGLVSWERRGGEGRGGAGSEGGIGGSEEGGRRKGRRRGLRRPRGLDVV